MAWDPLWQGTDDEWTVHHARDITRLPLTDDHLVAGERQLRLLLGYSLRGTSGSVTVTYPVASAYQLQRQAIGEALSWLAAGVLTADGADTDTDAGPLVESVATGDQSVTFATPVRLGAAQAATRVDYHVRARRILAAAGALGHSMSGASHPSGGHRAPWWAVSPIVNDI